MVWRLTRQCVAIVVEARACWTWPKMDGSHTVQSYTYLWPGVNHNLVVPPHARYTCVYFTSAFSLSYRRAQWRFCQTKTSTPLSVKLLLSSVSVELTSVEFDDKCAWIYFLQSWLISLARWKSGFYRWLYVKWAGPAIGVWCRQADRKHCSITRLLLLGSIRGQQRHEGKEESAYYTHIHQA